MGLFRTVYETNGNSVENRKIFSHRVFCAHAEGYPWNWVSALGVQKTRMMRLRAEKEV